MEPQSNRDLRKSMIKLAGLLSLLSILVAKIFCELALA